MCPVMQCKHTSPELSSERAIYLLMLCRIMLTSHRLFGPFRLWSESGEVKMRRWLGAAAETVGDSGRKVVQDQNL